jgi:PAS domain S-box-containing protein
MNMSQADCGAIFDAVSDAILIHDVTTGEILEVNRGMCSMFGYSPEEARQLKVTALCGDGSGSQLEPFKSWLAQVAARGPQVFEWQARDRAGRVFWVEVHLKPIRLEGRDRVLAVLRDIDQRKRAEGRCRKAGHTAGHRSGRGYVIRTKPLPMNPLWLDFRYRPEEIISDDCPEIRPPDDLPSRANISGGSPNWRRPTYLPVSTGMAP